MMVVVLELYRKVEVVVVVVEAFHPFVFVEIACTFVVNLVYSSWIVAVVVVAAAAACAGRSVNFSSLSFI
jgi:hypothetical protein